MKKMCVGLLLLFVMSCAIGQDKRLGPQDGQDLPPVDMERVRVGTAAPDFTLESKDGELITLSSFKAKKNVVLVFYRGYWWPYCVTQLVELKELKKDPLLADAQIIAVAIDSKPDLKKMFDTVTKKDGNPPDFLFLSDAGHRVINRYGIFNQSGNGLPHPATYVIDKGGIVRFRSVDVDYRLRPTNQQILEALKTIR